MGVHHVLMRFLYRIELRLLIGIKQRTDLGHCTIHDRLHLLHRLLMNGGDLRFGRIEDRLDLRLLISGQVQFVGDPPQAERVSMPRSSATRAAGTRLCLHNHKASKCDRTGGHNC